MKENAHSSQYLLMNKDVCILHFSCTHNEFGEVLFAEEEWLVQYRPIGYHGLQDFLEQRRAPKHRAHIRELLEQCGCGDMEGFLRVTHALSLNDTFWVKGTESPLNWKEVSLYRNEFNEVISRAAFDGTLTMQILCMVPVFDNNRSLFPELDKEQLSRPEWYVEKCRPRLGRDFIVNAKGLLTDAIRSDLKNLQGFSFHAHPDVEIPTRRLRLLSKIVNRQIDRIFQE